MRSISSLNKHLTFRAMIDRQIFGYWRPAWRDCCILMGLWAFCTLWNLDKAFHIDDTGYLVIAQWIAQNPLPSIFCLLALGAIYTLAIRFAPQWPLAPTVILASSPAFIANQNSMVDILLLALWLGFFVALCTSDQSVRRLFRTAGWCSVAILTNTPTQCCTLRSHLRCCASVAAPDRWYADRHRTQAIEIRKSMPPNATWGKPTFFKTSEQLMSPGGAAACWRT
ncbi:MAG: hypothetical protein Q7T21_15480 [Gallionella sp.]|nr:hypothetical protein [Gallionella sp.]